MFLLLLVLALAPIASSSATDSHAVSRSAEDATADTVVILPEITVTATRTPTSATNSPSRVIVLDREDFLASGSSNLAQLLSARTTGFVRHYGSGGLATLSLRGAAPGQTLLLVDGQRLSDPQTGQFDISLLPTILLDNVELIHGAGSALYGSDGVAGVINLRTSNPASSPGYAVRAEAGAYGERAIAARGRATAGNWGIGIASEFRRSEGDYPLGPVLARYGRTHRIGADREQATIYASASHEGARNELKLAAWVAATERGLPGPVTTPPVGERQWDRQARVWVSDRFVSGGKTWELSGGAHLADLRYLNPQLQLDETGATTTYFLEGSLSGSNDWARITGGLSGDLNYASHPSRRDAAILHGAAFVAAAADVGRLEVFPALRLDAYEADAADTRIALSPKLGVSLPLLSSPQIQTKASIGRTFRAPTLNERFWQPGGDPDLLPEQGWHGDVGLVMSGRRVSTEVSAFASSITNEIMWVRSPAGHYAAENLHKTRSIGVEWAADANAPLGGRRYVNGGAVVTLTRATDRSDPSNASFGEQLRYVPRVQAKAHLSLHAGPFSLDLNGRYVSRRFVTSDGTQWVDPYFVADAQIRFRSTIAGAATTLALAIQNMLDEPYSIIQHYPMPPRHLRITLNIADLP